MCLADTVALLAFDTLRQTIRLMACRRLPWLRSPFNPSIVRMWRFSKLPAIKPL